MKPSVIKQVLPELFAMRRPVFIHGPSGAGKSSVVRQVCGAHDLMLRDVRMSQLDSIDLKGFPVPDIQRGVMKWLQADFLPTKDDPPGVLFLDEMNAAMPAVLSPAYQLILDLRLGDYEFPDHWRIVAAGNAAGDRGVTHQMPAPLNNRFLHIDYTIDADDWHKQALEDGIDRMIRSYLRLKPASLHVFDSAKNPRSFPTPRTWYFADQILKRKLKATVQHELLVGTIGEGAAAELTGFIKNAADMPDLDSIAMNPSGAKLPGNQSVMHAVVTTLVDEKVTASTFDRYMLYVERLPVEIQVVFVRSCVAKDEDGTTSCAAYQDWAIKNQSALVGRD